MANLSTEYAYNEKRDGEKLRARMAAYQQNEPEIVEQPGLLSDVSYTVNSAINRGLASTSRAVNTVAGDGIDGKFIQRLDANADYGMAQLSDAQTEANQQEFITEDEDGYGIGEAATNPRSYLNVAGQGVGSIIPIALSGGILGSALKKGALKLAGTEGLATSVAGAAGYGIAETAMVTGAVSGEIQRGVDAMPDDVIATVPSFRDSFYSKLEQGTDDETAFAEAKAELGRELGVQGMKDVALPSLALGTIAGTFLNKFLTGKLTGNRLQRAGKGTAVEGLSESGQGSAEHYTTQNQLSQVDTSIDPTQGLLNAGFTEGLGGSIVGGGLGTISRQDVKPDNDIDVSKGNDLLGIPKLDEDEVIVFNDGSQARASEIYQYALKETNNPEFAQGIVDRIISQKSTESQQQDFVLPDFAEINSAIQQQNNQAQEFLEKQANNVSLINQQQGLGFKQRPSVLSRDNPVHLINQSDQTEFKEKPTKRNERDQAYAQVNALKQAEIDQDQDNREKKLKAQKRREVDQAIDELDLSKKGKKALRKFMFNQRVKLDNRKSFIENLGFDIIFNIDNGISSGNISYNQMELALKKAQNDQRPESNTTTTEREQNNTGTDGANAAGVDEAGINEVLSTTLQGDNLEQSTENSRDKEQDGGNADTGIDQFTEDMVSLANELGDTGAQILEDGAIKGLSNDDILKQLKEVKSDQTSTLQTNVPPQSEANSTDTREDAQRNESVTDERVKKVNKQVKNNEKTNEEEITNTQAQKGLLDEQKNKAKEKGTGTETVKGEKTKLPYLSQKESDEINSLEKEDLSTGYLRGRFGSDRLTHAESQEIVDAVQQSRSFTNNEQAQIVNKDNNEPTIQNKRTTKFNNSGASKDDSTRTKRRSGEDVQPKVQGNATVIEERTSKGVSLDGTGEQVDNNKTKPVLPDNKTDSGANDVLAKDSASKSEEVRSEDDKKLKIKKVLEKNLAKDKNEIKQIEKLGNLKQTKVKARLDRLKEKVAKREKILTEQHGVIANGPEVQNKQAKSNANNSQQPASQADKTNSKKQDKTPVVQDKVSGDKVEAGKVKFSKSTKTTGSTKQQIESLIPRRVKRVMGDNLVVVQSIADLPRDLQEKANDNVEGLFSGNKVYLVANNLSKDNIQSVVAHELLHYKVNSDSKLKAKLDSHEAGLRDIFDKIQEGTYKGRYKKLYDAAIKNVKDADTIAEDEFNEFLSYSVSQFNKVPDTLPGKLKQAIQKLISFIKMQIGRLGIPLTKLTPSDLSSLAMRIIKVDNKTDKVDKGFALASKQGYKDSGNLLASKAPKDESVKFSKRGNTGWRNQKGFEGVTDSQFDTISKIGPPGNTFTQNLKESFDKHRYLWRNKLRQGIVDQYDSFSSVIGDKKAWMMANLSNTGGAVAEAAIEFGRPFMDKSGAVDIDTDKKSLAHILEPLGDELDRFLMWIAGNRAEGLKVDGKENLFSDADIIDLKGLANGDISIPSMTVNGVVKKGINKNRLQLYEKVRKDFEEMHNAIVKIGVDTGLVSKEDAKLWKDQGFYIPFYRLSDESANSHGVQSVSGLVKQQAYKKLKGADMQLNDLLGNTLMNWNHLIGASLKNQAAAKALDSATKIGLAKEIKASDKDKNSIFIRDNGKEKWYSIDKSQEGMLVLDSLTALNYNGLNNTAMKVMRTFKRALTIGVTASPQFKIANLIRDSMQAIAVADMSTNITKNLYQGFKATGKGNKSIARMIGGGGAFGDSGYIHGADPDAIKRVLDKGVERSHIIDTRGRFIKIWDKYKDFGARLENVNRAANFEQALAQGKDLLEANFEARDHLDFARTGSAVAVRALAQMVPFLNARLQGLDKLGRAGIDKGQRKQFGIVVGAYSLMSVALYLSMKDDEDFQEAEQWERDTYHLFKLPGSEVMYRIPRPFEVGAIANMVERAAEQMVDDKVHGELFAERLWHSVTETFAMNPVPQMFKPIIETWANKNSFTGRGIESQSMKRLSKTERKKAWTSQTAIGLSKAMDAILWDDVVLSPVQVEHLVNGYLGWAGATTLASIDVIARPALDVADKPESRIEDTPIIGRFVREGKGRSSRFITEFYQNQREITQHYYDIKRYRDNQEFDKANKLFEEYKNVLYIRKHYNRISRRLSKLNKDIRLATNHKTMSRKEKRRRVDRANAERIRITKKAVNSFNAANN